MQKTCRQCQAPFDHTDGDLALAAKISPTIAGKQVSLPPPTLCPQCRLQRRLAWRMERNLYFRKCDLSGQKILSIVAPDSPYKAYHHESWYSDKWDALSYGRDFDFNRPFFEQFAALMREVPLLALNVLNNQNCEFVNQIAFSKNCYLVIEADYNENCLYSYRIFYSKSSQDCSEVTEVERCYECTDCEHCHSLLWSQLCRQCSSSSFLYDCRGCQHCFGCTGLRQQKYCMFNQQLTREQYEMRMKSFDYCNPQHVRMALDRFEALKAVFPRKNFIGEQNENVSGSYIYESKDCSASFGLRKCRDCRHCLLIRESKDCMDYYVFGAKAERMYECECCGSNVQNQHFCCDCFESHDLQYCLQCVNSSADCFGCIGLRHQQYCILNKQYTRIEYESLVSRVIEHMKKTGEWGEYFPMNIAPYTYNETAAQEFFPLSKEQVIGQGLQWRDQLPFTVGKETITWDKVPRSIAAIPDTITQEVLACEATRKNFRITAQELQFYRDMKLPIPRLHPDERHRRRIVLRNPYHLWKRPCAKCGKEMETTYEPSRPETVYCEECYLKEVY